MPSTIAQVIADGVIVGVWTAACLPQVLVVLAVALAAWPMCGAAAQLSSQSAEV
jgi:hypothetical protein